MSDSTAATFAISVELDGQTHQFQCGADQTVLVSR
jgi:hypothetical protein